jgi:hypothetical protein
MGFDLISYSGREFRFTRTGWTYFLNLAMQYGWVPNRTRKPKGFGLFKKWPGNYDTTEGQRVLADDAINLAMALEKALSHPSLHDKALELARGLTAAIEEAIERPLGYEISSDIEHEFVRGFIEFCRQGAFEIR